MGWGWSKRFQTVDDHADPLLASCWTSDRPVLPVAPVTKIIFNQPFRDERRGEDCVARGAATDVRFLARLLMTVRRVANRTETFEPPVPHRFKDRTAFYQRWQIRVSGSVTDFTPDRGTRGLAMTAVGTTRTSRSPSKESAYWRNVLQNPSLRCEQAIIEIAIDGSKFKAVNARDKNFTEAKMKRRLERIDESIARYLSQLETADRHGDAAGSES
jgi:hypothetical protein